MALILTLLQLLQKLNKTVWNRLADQLVISFAQALTDLPLQFRR
jgi:hypothetical protein